MLLQGINRTIRGHDHVNKGIKDKSCQEIFSEVFSNKVANNRKTGKDSSGFDFTWVEQMQLPQNQ